MNIGDLFFTLRSDGKGLEKDVTKQATAAGNKAGAVAGKSMGASMGKALKVGIGVGVGVAAAVAVRGLTGAISSGVASLRELGVVEAQTNAVIKSTGNLARVTTKHIRALSEATEDKTTIDDKTVQAGANMLLTFTNVRNEVGEGNDIFDQSIGVLADMSTALGKDMPTAAIALGKALNDPVKGITALSRVGVAFDAQQKERIKAFVAEGKVIEAQRIILAELNKEFGGSGAAFAATDAGKAAKFADAIEGIQMSLARALLPAITRVQEALTKFLSDPATMGQAEKLGEMIASIFSEGNLKTAASLMTGAAEAIGTAFKLFGSLPPQLQALAVGALALKKLTGIGPIDIVKTIGGELFKRGGSPANPLFVSDVAGGLSGPGGGKLGPLGLLLSASVAAGIIAVALPIGEAFADALPDEWKGPNGAGESESQRRIREGKEAMAREAARRPGNLGARGLGNAIDPNAGNMAARGLGNKLTTIDATLTAMQRQLHADLSSAIEVIKTSSDPKALAAAVETIIASIRGGAGSADTTNRTIADLSSSRDAALARGDTATAKLFSDAIGRLEPFAKGRQWQAEQIAEARKVVDSNKTTAEKVAALKGIQSDLLSHQRTMAAGIVGKLLDVERAVNKVRIPSPTVIAQIIGGGDSTPPKTPPKSGAINPGGGEKIPIRASGGPVTAGLPYWVGEHKRPELFVPQTAGRIVPLSGIQGGGGSDGGSFNPTINIQGLIPYRDPFEIAQQLKRVRQFVTVTPRRTA